MAGSFSDVVWYPGVSNTLLAILCSFVFFGILRRAFGNREKLPPGPPRIPFPFNLVASLLSSGTRMQLLMSLKERYGDLVSIDIDGKPKILVGSPELVRELLVKQGDVTSNRVPLKALKHIIEYDRGIAFSHGEDWQALRRFTLSALRNFGMGKRSIEHKITEEATMLVQILWKSQTDTGINPAKFLNNAVSNVICSITFGQRFEYSDPDFIDIVLRIKHLMGGNAPALLRMLFQKFPILFLSPLFARQRRNARGLKAFLVRQVQKHDETFDANDIRDIIDMFLAENRLLEQSDGTAYFRKSDIWMCVFDLFIAGTETTASALVWFILIMAGHRSIQEEVIREIDSVIGQERAPAYEDRKRMPYTEATLTEVLRYRPVGPTSLPHITSENVYVRDYTIPKGSELWLNVLGIHHDPELFPAPDEFDPDRFLSADKQTFVKHEAFVAFGAGRRSCLGEQLAKMEFFLFATSILQRFTISLPPGGTPNYSIGHRLRTLLPKEYNVHLTKR